MEFERQRVREAIVTVVRSGEVPDLSFYDIYLTALRRDFLSAARQVTEWSIASPQDQAVFKRITHVWSDELYVDAFVEPLNDGAKVVVRCGMALALDDLFHRCACMNDFFGETWEGGEVLVFEAMHAVPIVRYADYSPATQAQMLMRAVESTVPRGAGAGPGRFTPQLRAKQVAEPFLSLMQRTPIAPGRADLANALAWIAQCWVLWHEEGHYFRGHLHYLKGLRRSGVVAVSEADASGRAHFDHTLRRVMELQADASASHSVVDMFFGGERGWMPFESMTTDVGIMRTLLVAAGGTCLLFAKLEGSSWQAVSPNVDYPSALARLVGCVLSLVERAVTRFSVSDMTVVTSIITAFYDLNTISLHLGFGPIDAALVHDVLLVTDGLEAAARSKIFLEWRELFEIERREVVPMLLEARIAAVPEHEAHLRETGGRVGGRDWKPVQLSDEERAQRIQQMTEAWQSLEPTVVAGLGR